MKKNNNKGFTLMEMLIVVAIIAVLVAIAIPVFTNQLEKAREATDAANIRSAYAEVMAAALTDSDNVNGVTRTPKNENGTYYEYSKEVTNVAQKQHDWQNTGITEIAGKKIGTIGASTLKGWTITYSEKTGECTITEKTN